MIDWRRIAAFCCVTGVVALFSIGDAADTPSLASEPSTVAAGEQVAGGSASTSVVPVQTDVAAPAPVAQAQPALSEAEQQHALVVIRGQGVRVSEVERKEWYQEGFWPLIGAIVSVIVTNAVAVSIVYLQSSRQFAALLKQRRIDRLSLSLNEFYNPLLALIDLNKEIFVKTGPPAFPEPHIEREAAALIWNETKQKILDNNREIESILKKQTHLLHESDSISDYSELFLHVAMYEIFQRAPTDHYRGFRFPAGIREHIVTKRDVALSDLRSASGG